MPYLLPEHFVTFGGSALDATWSDAEAEQYTRWLATSHYENFHVVSFLLPKKLHQDFYNIYSFCRWADDLGDEIGDKAESLRLLDWWRRELDRCMPERRNILSLSHCCARCESMTSRSNRLPI